MLNFERMKNNWEYRLWKWKKFWEEMDGCAGVYDRRVEAGLEKPPSFLKEFRRGKVPLWKAVWGYTILPLSLFTVMTYNLYYVWKPLGNISFFLFAAHGILACDALRYTASRYQGAKVWRRVTQYFAIFLALGCGVVAMNFSAAAAGY
ncbi:hypothetical protein [Halodesulfovibrio sp.]|jgi:hypothetical protein|uniref:hypothetical protein n=1 Tax=Halodesulfovibrio sp. TaxID=1912772 RepID=UPI0025F7A1F2|nr:hypothetical protein [Halodesulfovibrio sp.]MCT4625834.1 hypothetical protein [Halodesulfovibrio sp.]